ncbi:hypothetical protein HanPSC8_Chr17g0774511 [Helianthus annuus]|nr:hypothetical protein HanPSC8_Chr17g0774511 [Helianthus annuus]
MLLITSTYYVMDASLDMIELSSTSFFVASLPTSQLAFLIIFTNLYLHIKFS